MRAMPGVAWQIQEFVDDGNFERRGAGVFVVRRDRTRHEPGSRGGGLDGGPAQMSPGAAGVFVAHPMNAGQAPREGGVVIEVFGRFETRVAVDPRQAGQQHAVAAAPRATNLFDHDTARVIAGGERNAGHKLMQVGGAALDRIAQAVGREVERRERHQADERPARAALGGGDEQAGGSEQRRAGPDQPGVRHEFGPGDRSGDGASGAEEKHNHQCAAPLA
jgi:hypothetical protein